MIHHHYNCTCDACEKERNFCEKVDRDHKDVVRSIADCIEKGRRLLFGSKINYRNDRKESYDGSKKSLFSADEAAMFPPLQGIFDKKAERAERKKPEMFFT